MLVGATVMRTPLDLRFCAVQADGGRSGQLRVAVAKTAHEVEQYLAIELIDLRADRVIPADYVGEFYQFFE